MKKLEGWKKVRDRAEELTISMDYLEQGTLKELRSRARIFLSAPEEEEPRISVVDEIENLIELSEQNRRKQSNFAMFAHPQTEQKQDRSDSLDLRNASDVVAGPIASLE